MAKVNLDELNKRIDAELITARKHPNLDLWIYNYTPKVQFSRTWDEYTLTCRGLILDGEGNIVARPFPKFFNLEEHTETLPSEPFSAAEKMDGSLGILYWDASANNYSLATRGSFTSDQAIKGTEMLRAYIAEHGQDWIDNANTYLFEIIYPDNRIVVNYGSAERLVLLAVINTETGHEDVALNSIDYADVVTMYPVSSLKSPADLKKLDVDVDNREGFVVRYTNGLRLKLKFDEYVRLHRILTQTSTTVIWEVLAVEDLHVKHPELTIKQVADTIRFIDKSKVEPIMAKNGKAIDSLLEKVPDEFYKWLKDQMADMTIGKDLALFAGERVLEQTTDRREIVDLCGNDVVLRSIAFSLLDGKKPQALGLAWRNIKPKWSKPFVVDNDA